MGRPRGGVRRVLPAAAAAVGLLLLPACAGGEGGAEDGLTVLTSSYPLQYVVTQVAGRDAQVRNLTASGADSHATELTPDQVASLGEADLVVHLSGMQAGVDEALQVQRPRELLDAAPLADRGGDPHFWLDPQRMATLAQQVADVLGELEPAAAERFRDAADTVAGDLAALDADYRTTLAGCEGAVLVTAHEAFGYLADAYGLEQVGIAGIDPHVEPSPARLRDVSEVVRDRDVRTLFFDAAVDPGVAATLAEDLGTGTAVLHPVERVEDGQTYPDLMRANLSALRDGLVCGSG